MMRALLIVAALCSARAAFVPTDLFEDSSSLEAEDSYGVCEKELSDLCKIEYSVDFEQSFQARMCLRAYRDLLSDECSAFIIKDSPSIVEPCYQEINTFCQGVQPGENRIYSCLMRQAYAGVSQDCQLALRDHDRMADIEATDTDDNSIDRDDDDLFEVKGQAEVMADSLASLWSLQMVVPSWSATSISAIFEQLVQHIAMEIAQVEDWFIVLSSTWAAPGTAAPSLRGQQQQQQDDDRKDWDQRAGLFDLVDADSIAQIKSYLRGAAAPDSK